MYIDFLFDIFLQVYQFQFRNLQNRMEKLESPREEVINFTSETVSRYSMYLKKFFLTL